MLLSARCSRLRVNAVVVIVGVVVLMVVVMSVDYLMMMMLMGVTLPPSLAFTASFLLPMFLLVASLILLPHHLLQIGVVNMLVFSLLLWTLITHALSIFVSFLSILNTRFLLLPSVVFV